MMVGGRLRKRPIRLTDQHSVDRGWRIAILVVLSTALLIGSLAAAGVFNGERTVQYVDARMGKSLLGTSVVATVTREGLKPWVVCTPNFSPWPGNGNVASMSPLGEKVPAGSYVNVFIAGSPAGCHSDPHKPNSGLYTGGGPY